MRRYNFGYFIAEGFRSIVNHGLMSFAAVCMSVCCLLIMGSFTLVAVNANAMLAEWEDENIILAYVDETLDEEAVSALQATLESIPNVQATTFSSREEAMEKYKDSNEDNKLLTDLPAEVFRDRYQIQVESLAQMSETIEQIKGTPGVAKIRTDPQVTEGFMVIRNIASLVAVILVIVLFLMSLFIISNTVKLATFNRREEIAIMKMCGATNAFVRWPFVVEGMILGLIGAGVAFALQWGLYRLIDAAVTTSDTLRLITLLPFAGMAPMLFLVFLVTGLIIGVLGSVLAIGKFLQV